jgi:hypothetical protein
VLLIFKTTPDVFVLDIVTVLFTSDVIVHELVSAVTTTEPTAAGIYFV